MENAENFTTIALTHSSIFSIKCLWLWFFSLSIYFFHLPICVPIFQIIFSLPWLFGFAFFFNKIFFSFWKCACNFKNLKGNTMYTVTKSTKIFETMTSIGILKRFTFYWSFSENFIKLWIFFKCKENTA